MEVSRSADLEATDGQTIEDGQTDKKKLDKHVMTAAREAIESGSLIPLIKEELWCKIQTRRLSEGKGELKLTPKSHTQAKLSIDDLEKRKVRREQNKTAARRFRVKVREKADLLIEKIADLQKQNDTLEHLRQILKTEKLALAKRLEDHLKVCTSSNDIPNE